MHLIRDLKIWQKFLLTAVLAVALCTPPTALLVLTCTAVFMYFGLAQWMWAGSLGCLAIVWVVGPKLPRSASPNAKIGLLGSRFSPA